VLWSLVAWLAAAYWLIPEGWKLDARWHPSLDANPRVTQTSDGHPGDPLNVALVGDGEQLKACLERAGWQPAAALGLRSDLEIAADSVLDRPDADAPVSDLFLFGRKEDVAFEQPVGDSPRRRHHVRFWRTASDDPDGRPVWIGAATYDRSVGLSHTTGQITHHIDGRVDAERDRLFENLQRAGGLREDRLVAGFHSVREGRNGGGDLWQTDGALRYGVLSTDAPR
jgi:hypothetical protein